MKPPLSLSVAGPSARKHAPAVAVAACLVVLQVGVSLLAPWPLALAILRLYDVHARRILIDGIDVRDCDQHSVRSRFAYVPQDPWLLDATVAENIAFGNPRATRDDVLEAGRAALVDEFIGRLPHNGITRPSLRRSGNRRNPHRHHKPHRTSRHPRPRPGRHRRPGRHEPKYRTPTNGREVNTMSRIIKPVMNKQDDGWDHWDHRHHSRRWRSRRWRSRHHRDW
jgi:hypothetical protein